MATPVREYIWDMNNRVNMENFEKLRKAVDNKVCNAIVKKTKKVCGRPYMVMPSGRCGCWFHEDYSEALKALNTLENAE